MRISDWSSDVCSSDLAEFRGLGKVFINLQTGEYKPLSGAPHVIYYTTRSTLEAKRDALVRFTRAIGHALDWIQKNPDEAEKIMADYLKDMDTELVRIAWNSGFHAFPAPPEIDREEIGRAHVSTPVTNAPLVCRHMLETK